MLPVVVVFRYLLLKKIKFRYFILSKKNAYELKERSTKPVPLKIYNEDSLFAFSLHGSLL